MEPMRETAAISESIAAPTGAGPWHQGVTKKNVRTLIASFLGWGFDGFETYALTVALVPIMTSVLSPAQRLQLPLWGGVAVGVTLLGWAIGGVIGGVLADYVGRKRVMLISVAAYAAFTCLTALSMNLEMLIVLRFVTGLCLGSEWATGTALVAETWPTRARAKAAGFMQSGFGFGALLAATIWLGIGSMGPDAWRVLFVIGVLPAIFTVYIRRTVEESETWKRTRHAEGLPETTAKAAPAPRKLTLREIFSDATIRRRVLLTLVLSLFTLGAYYTVSTSLPLYIKELAASAGRTDVSSLTSLAGMTYTAGSIVGYVAGGFIADRIGRRPYIAIFLIGSVITTALLYYGSASLEWAISVSAVNGFFTLGIFAAFAIYLPELFPSRVRGTAIGFVFNSTRLIACLGPIYFGSLVLSFGGPERAAMIIGSTFLIGLFVLPLLPETRGTELPE